MSIPPAKFNMLNEPTRFIAIVDDDRAVRTAISSLIRSLGWKVRVYDSAQDFLQLNDMADTACLISDVRMPHISGIEMHDRLIELGHILPTIFISAFPSPSLTAKLDAPGVVAILYKPFDANAMAECMTRALGTP
jgi:FixJ family two-component response regulator